MPNRPLSLEPTLVLRLLGGVAAVLLLLSLAGQIAVHVLGLEVRGIVSFFDVGREHNIPTSYAVFLLASCGAVLLIIALQTYRLGRPDATRWGLLSAGFLVMAYDEGFQIHEHFVGPMQSLLGGGNLGMLNYAWIVPGALLVTALGLFFLGFLTRLPRETCRGFVLAAALYLGGCLGIEAIGGGYDAAHGYDNLTYNLLTTLEEGLEMVGLVVFLSHLLGYVGGQFGEVSFRVGSRLEPLPQRVRRDRAV